MISKPTASNNPERQQTDTIKQLVIMFDNSDCNELSLRNLILLASLLKVKIRGLYIEDNKLLSAVALPFAREISSTNAQVRGIDVNSLIRHLHARAAELNALLAEYAQEASVEFSFESRQGNLFSIIHTQEMAACLVVLPAVKSGSLRSEMAELVSLKPGVVACLYDGSESADIALQLTSTLAKKIMADVLVLVTSHFLSDQLYFARLTHSVTNINIETINPESTLELHACLRKYAAAMLIAPGKLFNAERLERLQKSSFKTRYDIILVS